MIAGCVGLLAYNLLRCSYYCVMYMDILNKEILNCVVTLACLSKNLAREIIYYYRLSLPQSFWPMYCVGRNNTEGNLEQGKFGGKGRNV